MAIEHDADADGDAEQRSRLARALATSGFEDVLVTDRETAKKVRDSVFGSYKLLENQHNW